MPRRVPFQAGLLVTLGATLACADGSPSAPVEAVTALAAARPAPVAGTYEQMFRFTSEGLTMVGRVEYAATGLSATDGMASFYACKLGSEFVPSEECATGRGHWAPQGRASVVAQGPDIGNALRHFGFCPAGTIVGFRFQYDGTRDGIENGWSPPADFVFPA